MHGIECNYQRKVTSEELLSALAVATCHHCEISAKDLLLTGDILEVCAEEFASDIANGQRVLVPIALCPSCHQKHHLDACGNHNPCQIKARFSREMLDYRLDLGDRHAPADLASGRYRCRGAVAGRSHDNIEHADHEVNHKSAAPCFTSLQIRTKATQLF